MRVEGEELASVARALRTAADQVPSRAVGSALSSAIGAVRGSALAGALAELESVLVARLRALDSAVDSLSLEIDGADRTFEAQDAEVAAGLTRGAEAR